MAIADPRGRASPDVAGGDGRFSTGLLLKHYGKVDLFEQCPVAVKKAENVMKAWDTFGYAERARYAGRLQGAC